MVRLKGTNKHRNEHAPPDILFRYAIVKERFLTVFPNNRYPHLPEIPE